MAPSRVGWGIKEARGHLSKEDTSPVLTQSCRSQISHGLQFTDGVGSKSPLAISQNVPVEAFINFNVTQNSLPKRFPVCQRHATYVSDVKLASEKQKMVLNFFRKCNKISPLCPAIPKIGRGRWLFGFLHESEANPAMLLESRSHSFVNIESIETDNRVYQRSPKSHRKHTYASTYFSKWTNVNIIKINKAVTTVDKKLNTENLIFVVH